MSLLQIDSQCFSEYGVIIKFVFLTMRDDPNLAGAALGPVGFALKNSAGQELLKAIDHVLAWQALHNA
jgi:DNA-binding NarL/FixJ family response regulator